MPAYPLPETEAQRGLRVGALGNKARMFKQRLCGGKTELTWIHKCFYPSLRDATCLATEAPEGSSMGS